jgi:hypothetical protein
MYISTKSSKDNSQLGTNQNEAAHDEVSTLSEVLDWMPTTRNDSTHVGGKGKDLFTDFIYSPSQDVLLSEESGIITEYDQRSVYVKLHTDLIVEFPIALFNKNELIKGGAQIKYQIFKDSEGYRYQKIEVLENSFEVHPQIAEILG